MAKRILDFSLAVLLAPFGLLIVLLCGILIFIDDRHSPLFRQMRVGKDGDPFILLKLRTMRVGTPDLPSHESSPAQFTRLGRFLRRTKLDELPQLWNVLRGDMSFVGPRPCLTTQHELIACRDALGLKGLRPGITGPAQVRGIDMSHPERLARADAIYLSDWSLLADMRYIVATFTGAGAGDAVKAE